ncbi:MAG: hypothetical protein ACHQVS_00795 [Candidatus Babeliales bacterium]
MFVIRERIPKVDPRRRQERADAAMISEGEMAPANMPTQASHHTFNAWKYPERLAMYDQSEGQD